MHGFLESSGSDDNSEPFWKSLTGTDESESKN